jgi:hypothetical protein
LTQSTRPHWRALVVRRLKTGRHLKIPATVIGIAAFFVAYFWVMAHPAPWATLREVPPLAFDRWLVVREWAIVPYGSLWLYVVLAPALTADHAEFRSYVGGALALSAVGLLTFWLYPTAVPPFDVDWQQYPMLEFLKTRDGRANAFPSMHVAFATFTAVVLNAQLRACEAPRLLRGLNVAWAVAIAYSALATRQHVVLDAAAGALLGALVFMPLRAIRRGGRPDGSA